MYTMVRILPMDKKNEFKYESIQKIQTDFFLEDFPNRNDNIGYGKFHYKTRGMKIDKNTTLVLFQYDNKIIACANIYDKRKFNKSNGIYHGAFYFEPTSIKVFSPITNEELNNIFHCKKTFGQIKHHLKVDYVNDFMNKLEKIRSA